MSINLNLINFKKKDKMLKFLFKVKLKDLNYKNQKIRTKYNFLINNIFKTTFSKKIIK